MFSDLHTLYPDRIVNKTNGITFRRWLHQANPGLTALLVETLRRRACSTIRSRLASFATLAGDAALQERDRSDAACATRWRWRGSSATRSTSRVDPRAMFDVQIKRIHEYKRQLLNLLETIALYHAIRAEPDARLGAAREDLRRQGGGELHARRS